jgi:hypothetical protein
MELSESRFEAMYRDLIELRVLSGQRYIEASRRADVCDQQTALVKAEIRQELKETKAEIRQELKEVQTGIHNGLEIFQAEIRQELKDISNQLCAQRAEAERRLTFSTIITAFVAAGVGSLLTFLIQRVL